MRGGRRRARLRRSAMRRTGAPRRRRRRARAPRRPPRRPQRRPSGGRRLPRARAARGAPRARSLAAACVRRRAPRRWRLGSVPCAAKEFAAGSTTLCCVGVCRPRPCGAAPAPSSCPMSRVADPGPLHTKSPACRSHTRRRQRACGAAQAPRAAPAAVRPAQPPHGRQPQEAGHCAGARVAPSARARAPGRAAW